MPNISLSLSLASRALSKAAVVLFKIYENMVNTNWEDHTRNWEDIQ
jgi:hypothetical protein